MLETPYPEIKQAVFVRNMKIMEIKVISLNIREFQGGHTKIHETSNGSADAVKARLI